VKASSGSRAWMSRSVDRMQRGEGRRRSRQRRWLGWPAATAAQVVHASAFSDQSYRAGMEELRKPALQHPGDEAGP